VIRVKTNDVTENAVYRLLLDTGDEVVLAVTSMGKARTVGVPVQVQTRNYTLGDDERADPVTDEEHRLRGSMRVLSDADTQGLNRSRGQPTWIRNQNIIGVQHIMDVEEAVEADETLTGVFDVFREVERYNDEGKVLERFVANPELYDPDANEDWADTEGDQND
jgi:hypothetical protein